MTAIRIENVTKVYANGVKAVDGVDLEVADGEFMVLVGPSGCGKTTLLRMIAGLEDVSDGRISIGDREVTDVAARDRDVAGADEDPAVGDLLEAADRTEQRGLAAPRRADEDHELALADREVDVVHRRTPLPKSLVT